MPVPSTVAARPKRMLPGFMVLDPVCSSTIVSAPVNRSRTVTVRPGTTADTSIKLYGTHTIDLANQTAFRRLRIDLASG